MPQHSFESRLSPVPTPSKEHGPVLEGTPPGTDPGGQRLRIFARRIYATSAQEVFAAWTHRTAWDNWMRLRARSRSAVAAYPGGAFRLELADGATIHVVTGAFAECHAPDHLQLVWQRHNGADDPSTIDVVIQSRMDATEMTLTHSDIASRREAAWLMRLWATVLRRLDAYLAIRGIQRPVPPQRALRLIGNGVASATSIRPASSRG
jgi:uncharacterized protein YndB with AHSA1/START domain